MDRDLFLKRAKRIP